jgi:hypothetical protein
MLYSMALQSQVGLDFTITLRHTPLPRTPLNEWSVRRRDLYLTTHNTHNINTPSGIRTHNPSNRAAALRQLGRSLFHILPHFLGALSPLLLLGTCDPRLELVDCHLPWSNTSTVFNRALQENIHMSQFLPLQTQPSVTIRLLRPSVCIWPLGALPHLRWNCFQINTHLKNVKNTYIPYTLL